MNYLVKEVWYKLDDITVKEVLDETGFNTFIQANQYFNTIARAVLEDSEGRVLAKRSPGFSVLQHKQYYLDLAADYMKSSHVPYSELEVSEEQDRILNDFIYQRILILEEDKDNCNVRMPLVNEFCMLLIDYFRRTGGT